MIDLTEARQGITEVLEQIQVPYPGGAAPLKVYPRAVTEVPLLPCAVIGLPNVTYSTGPCMDTTTVPVAIAVGRDGTDDAATQAQLEALWVEAAAVLNAAFDAGRFAGVTVLKSADFDPLPVQGQTYPAQVLTIEFHR